MQEVKKAGGGYATDGIRSIDKGGNMAAPLLAEAVGGTGFLGFIAAVAFATILAVVAGLTLSGAATLSHDLWVNVVKQGEATEREQFIVAKVATVVLALLSIALGIIFKGQNVAYMVGLAFAIAASANFPALVLSIFWRRLTTARGSIAPMRAAPDGEAGRDPGGRQLIDPDLLHPGGRRPLVEGGDERIDGVRGPFGIELHAPVRDRKSTRLNSSHRT